MSVSAYFMAVLTVFMASENSGTKIEYAVFDNELIIDDPILRRHQIV